MKKLMTIMALAGLFVAGCAHNRGGTSEGNYNTSDTDKGKMQDNANQPQGSATATNSNSNAQQP